MENFFRENHQERFSDEDQLSLLETSTVMSCQNLVEAAKNCLSAESKKIPKMSSNIELTMYT